MAKSNNVNSMVEKQRSLHPTLRALLLAVSAGLLSGSVLEFYKIAWGTGVSLGQLSLKWASVLFLFICFCILCLLGIRMVLWRGETLEGRFQSLARWRDRLGVLRWAFAALFLAVPIYFLQYTFWGLVLHGPYLRILLAVFSGIWLGWMLTKEPNQFIGWQGVLIASVLLSGAYTLFVSLREVTDYPFSLGWSEGNRLWDYSILFGRHLYSYPSDQPIPVLLDIGRKFIGGVPFLIPGIKIEQVRLWLALIDIVPYLLLGWAAFRLDRKHGWHWFLAGIWAFTFVRQGPIHPPLLLSAIAVALAWRRPLWLAVPLIVAASYFAEISRFTWLFAPGLWAVMLELSGSAVPNQRLEKKTWLRAISVGIAGVLGGYIAPFSLPGLVRWAGSLGRSASVPPSGVTDPIIRPSVTVSTVSESISDQPLLWYRLLPNATYGEGILIGLILVVLPLVIVLIYLAATGRWKLDRWQQLAILLPLLAFLVVGLIVSVKIGGGGDLHNLDMFIIGLMFAAALAWRSGACQWITEVSNTHVWLRVVILALVLIPGYKPLLDLRPLAINEDLTTVATLADIPGDPLPNPLPDTLPAKSDTERALTKVQQAVAQAAQTGEVLFMDQRQLLTFGDITDIPLIAEYDKKVLINQAMSGDAEYFKGFYRDLASQRFSLIITSPVNRRLEKTEGHFGEENNAWVKWVTTPLLCYYQPLDRLKRVDIDLLVPNPDISACDEVLPVKMDE